MSNRPKSISIHELTSAIKVAVEKLKLDPGQPSPWLRINPGVICGLVYVGPAAEAQSLAASIAKEVSAKAGIQLTPVVEEGGAGEKALAAGTGFPHRPVILGYRHDLQVHI